MIQQHFSGDVQVGNQVVQVRDGIANVGGRNFFVNDDGLLVADVETGRLVGIIVDGVFHKITQEIVTMLQEMGMLEER